MEKNALFSQRIRLRHLHAFVAVAQQGTLGRAAETLKLSQPALSKTLNELEQLTATRLVDRGRMGTHLTGSGEQFLTHAINVLEALNHASQSLSPAAGKDADVVRIGALPTAALGILPCAIGQFHTQHTTVALQATTMSNTMLLAALKSGELDIGIGRMSDPDLMTGLNYELLFLESLKLVVCQDHPLLHSAFTLSQVPAWPAVLPPSGTTPRHNAEMLLASQGCPLPATRIETLSASLSRQLAVEFNYVWFVPSGAVQHDLRQGTLAALPVVGQAIGEPIGILTRVDIPFSPGAQALLACIRQSAAD